MTPHPEYPHLPHPDWVAERLRVLGLSAQPATPNLPRAALRPSGTLNEEWRAALSAGDLDALKSIARRFHNLFHSLPAELQHSGNGRLMHSIGHHKFPDSLTPDALAAITALPLPAPLPKSLKRSPGYAAE